MTREAMRERLRPIAAINTHDWGLLGLRCGGFGLLWAYHVHHKLLGLGHEWRTFPDPLGIGHPASLVLALLSEGLCSSMVAVGLATRLSAVPIVVSMGMVLVLVARGDPGADLQLALLYALVFGGIALLGPGRLSLDHALRSRYEALLQRARRVAPWGWS